MQKGMIFNIQKFSIHDGPGIRTTVFFKGCPLSCKWCANPESQMIQTQILHDAKKCVHCHACEAACTNKAITFQDDTFSIDHTKCKGCLSCLSVCPTHALTKEGEQQDIDTIVKECLKDIDFYEESGGGITLSGGEAMMQPEFLEALVKQLKQHHLHCAIETTGYVNSATFQKLALLFDLILFDVKHYDSKQHYLGTNVYNEQIIENLTWLLQQKIPVLPRIPVIPNFNDSLEDAIGFCELFHKIGAKKVQLLCFHQFGEKKYELLHRDYELKTISALHPEDLQTYKDIFLSQGIECFI